jgi:hypothetical protein
MFRQNEGFVGEIAKGYGLPLREAVILPNYQ